MGISRALKFRELVEILTQNNCRSSICRLLNIHVPKNEYDELSLGWIPELLMSRLYNTWWEVSWPNGDKENIVDENATYKYIADNIEDLMRLKPEIDIPFWHMAYEFAANLTDDEDFDDVDFGISYKAFDKYDTFLTCSF